MFQIKNKIKKQPKIFHPWIITINVALIFFFGNAWSFSLAQVNNSNDSSNQTQASTSNGGTNTNSATVDPANNARETQCLSQMNAFVDEKFKDYKDFMETHFKNKSGTIYLLPAALEKYKAYKQALYDKLGEFENGNNQNLQADQQLQFQFLVRCRDKVKKEVIYASKLLSMRAETTSSVKKSTAILEKYKQINAKLRELNLQFLKMKANLGTFSQKLPCYLRKQCVKG